MECKALEATCKNCLSPCFEKEPNPLPILLHKPLREKHWYYPGGSIQPAEPAATAKANKSFNHTTPLAFPWK